MELDFSKKIQDSSDLGSIFNKRKERARLNELSDSDFAYIEAGGKKDSTGRTVPRTLRHFPMSSEDQINSSLESIASSSLNKDLKLKIFDKIESHATKTGIKIKKEKAAMDKNTCAEKSEPELTEKEKKLPPAIQKSILEKQKKGEKGDQKKEEPKEKSDAMKIEEDDAMMKKMNSRMSEIEKARKDMDKEYATIKNKLGAMMKKLKANPGKDD